MKLIRVLVCLLFLVMVGSASFAHEEIVDLGETGFSCPLNLEEIEKDYLTVSRVKSTNVDSLNLFSGTNQDKAR